MCERQGAIGALGLHLGPTGFLLWAAGPKNTTDEVSFVKFTAQGSRSPKTLDALRGLRHAIERHGKKDHRGIISYSMDLGKGLLELQTNEHGDEYIRAVSPQSGVAYYVETEWSSDKGVQECFDRLYEAMVLDQKEFPQ